MAVTRLSYRDHSFVVSATQHGATWQGQFHLLDLGDDAPPGTSSKWVPLTPRWLTPREAETNATEAAHAAIDALVDGHACT